MHKWVIQVHDRAALRWVTDNNRNPVTFKYRREAEAEAEAEAAAIAASSDIDSDKDADKEAVAAATEAAVAAFPPNTFILPDIVRDEPFHTNLLVPLPVKKKLPLLDINVAQLLPL